MLGCSRACIAGRALRVATRTRTLTRVTSSALPALTATHARAWLVARCVSYRNARCVSSLQYIRMHRWHRCMAPLCLTCVSPPATHARVAACCDSVSRARTTQPHAVVCVGPPALTCVANCDTCPPPRMRMPPLAPLPPLARILSQAAALRAALGDARRAAAGVEMEGGRGAAAAAAATARAAAAEAELAQLNKVRSGAARACARMRAAERIVAWAAPTHACAQSKLPSASPGVSLRVRERSQSSRCASPGVCAPARAVVQ